jgi:hypothetical protein
MKIYIVIMFIIFYTQASAQSLAGKWSAEARKAIVFIEVPVTHKESGDVNTYTGTGFLISEQRHLLTASHVFKEWFEQNPAQKEENVIYGRVGGNTSVERYELRFIGAPDNVLDVALLQLISPPIEVQPLPLCFSSKILEGMDIVAYGFPFGQDLQPTLGTIGNNNAPDGRYAAASGDLAPGMSGGPVINQDGVIGIVKGSGTYRKKVTNNSGKDIGSVAVDISAFRWITPISFARNSVNNAPDFLKCDLDNEALKLITQFISFNGSIKEDYIEIECPEGWCKDDYSSTTSPLQPSVNSNGNSNGEIRISYNCTVTKKHWGKNPFSGKFDIRLAISETEEPAEVLATWHYNKGTKVVDISSIRFSGHQARNCGASIVDRLKRLNGKKVP